MICNSCGGSIPEHGEYCPACGAQSQRAEGPAAPPYQQPAPAGESAPRKKSGLAVVVVLLLAVLLAGGIATGAVLISRTKNTPFVQYVRALEKLESTDSREASEQTVKKYSNQEESWVTDTRLHFKYVNNNGRSELMGTMQLYGDDFEEAVKSKVWYKDGYFYAHSGDDFQKKMKMEDTNLAWGSKLTFAEEDVLEAKVEKGSKAGEVRLEMTLRGRAFEQQFSHLERAVVDDVTLNIRIDKDGVLTYAKYTMTAELTNEGTSLAYAYDSLYEVHSVNSVAEIDFPIELFYYEESVQ